MNAIDPFSRDWLPHGRLARRTRGLMLGGVWLRWVTRRQTHQLDEQLALGIDPIASDELSLRAGQLRSARSREGFARVLRGAVALADAPFDPTRLRPTIRRAQVRENGELLLELADRLRAGGSLGVQGLAMTSLLVRDGVSPLYSQAAGSSSLKASVNRALHALDGGLVSA